MNESKRSQFFQNFIKKFTPSSFKKIKKKWWFISLKALFKLTFYTAVLAGIVLAITGGLFYQRLQAKFPLDEGGIRPIIYAKPQRLSINGALTPDQLQHSLESLGYLPAEEVKQEGQYLRLGNQIEFIRGAFHFAEGYENAIHAMVWFEDNKISNIQLVDQDRKRSHLRLEPSILGVYDVGASDESAFLALSYFPKHFINSFIQFEDPHFFTRKHLDIKRTLAVSWQKMIHPHQKNRNNIRQYRRKEPLSQKLIHQLFMTEKASSLDPLYHAALSIMMDRLYSREEILQAYLNTAYLGQHHRKPILGFHKAAQLYFGTAVYQMTFEQWITLVGMLKKPGHYHPYYHPQRAHRRRDYVLESLHQNHVISDQQFQYMLKQPLGTQSDLKSARRKPSYMNMIERELAAFETTDRALLNKSKIFTTLDMVEAERIEHLFQTHWASLSQKTSAQLSQQITESGFNHTAIIADRQTGAVRVMKQSKLDTQQHHSPLKTRYKMGMLIDPFIYYTALSDPQRYTLATSLQKSLTQLADLKASFEDMAALKQQFRQQIPLYQAFANLQETPKLNLGKNLPLADIMTTLTSLGLERKKLPNHLGLLLQGEVQVTAFDMLQLYQTLFNLGNQADLYVVQAVLDGHGEEIYQHRNTNEQVLSSSISWLTLYALKRVISDGIGQQIEMAYPERGLAGVATTDRSRLQHWYIGADKKTVALFSVKYPKYTPKIRTLNNHAIDIYQGYLSLHAPEPWALTWPDDIDMVRYEYQQDGQLEKGCAGGFVLPVIRLTSEPTQKCD